MMDKNKLSEELTILVAQYLDTYDQRKAGIWPPDTDLDRWRRRYVGSQNLPANMLQINHFKTEVNDFVAGIMITISENESLE